MTTREDITTLVAEFEKKASEFTAAEPNDQAKELINDFVTSVKNEAASLDSDLEDLEDDDETADEDEVECSADETDV